MLEKALQRFFQDNLTLNEQNSYAIAVSGGPDSMALAHALLTSYPDKIFYLLTVDHGLRAESVKEAQKAGDILSSYKNGIHHILKWKGKKPDVAVMEAARMARYNLMHSFCADENIKTLFIAHHREDQAETFFIRLAKGSGIDGLTAMKPISQKGGLTLARPFLSLSKSDLISYCEDNNIDYISDPSNENEAYLRPRLRKSKEVLASEGLTDKRLAVTAKRLSRAQDALLYYVAELEKHALIKKTQTQSLIDFEQLQKAPEEITLRLLQNLIESYRTGYDYRVRMEKLEDLFESLIRYPDNFKPRTLGGCKISLIEKQTKLLIEKEKL